MADAPLSTLDGFNDEDELFIGEEPIFSRDASGQLIPLFTPTEDDLRVMVSITIDGMTVKVPKAVEAKDSQGNVLRDARGIKIIRPTTIYDAEVELRQRLGTPGNYEPVDRPVPDPTIVKEGCYQCEDRKMIHIPVLCHQEHLNPVAVCRACVVQLMRKDPKTKSSRPERKLLPACQHLVRDGMEVHTMESPVAEHRRTVRTAVQNLVELLSSDHLDQDATQRTKYRNELDEIRTRLSDHWQRVERLHQINPTAREAPGGKEEVAELQKLKSLPIRYASKPKSQELIDDSSPSIHVDRNNCILCDRCIRSCSEVKPFKVIGRTGKGFSAQITFDLGNPMGESSCRTCGECMVACPTGALTFKKPVFDEMLEKIEREGQIVEAAELVKHPTGLFAGMSFAFLQWNRGAIIRKSVKAGEMLCRQDDYGASAFILEKGRYAILIKGVPAPKGGAMLQMMEALAKAARDSVEGMVKEYGGPVADCGPNDKLLGEMSPMSNDRRNATIFAVENGEILDVKRNILYMLQRNEVAREQLNELYRDRAVVGLLRELTSANKGPFKGLSLNDEQKGRLNAFFRRHAEQLVLRRFTPNEIICSEGAEARNSFFIRLGFVKVEKRDDRGFDQVLVTLDRNKMIGDIAIVCEAERKAELLKMTLGRSANPGTPEVAKAVGRGVLEILRDDIKRQNGGEPTEDQAAKLLVEKARAGEYPKSLLEGFRSRNTPIGRRTATCVALDHAELIAIPGDLFDACVLMNPDIFAAFDTSALNTFGGPKK